MGKMSPAGYWNLAARVSAKAAIVTDCIDEQQFFASAQREANLMRLKGLLGPEARVINIGCGIGRIEHAIHSEVGSIVGVDVSSRMVELARQKVNFPNVSFRTVDGKSLDGFQSGAYDLCLSFVTLQHIPRANVSSYLAEVARVLRPLGHFLFQIPIGTRDQACEPPANHPFAMRFYSRREILELLQQSGMQLLECFDAEGNPAPADLNLENPLCEFFVARRPAA
jgi:ubiquinone/menaquinone biosynthesis C-methylase UbiE